MEKVINRWDLIKKTLDLWAYKITWDQFQVKMSLIVYCFLTSLTFWVLLIWNTCLRKNSFAVCFSALLWGHSWRGSVASTLAWAVPEACLLYCGCIHEHCKPDFIIHEKDVLHRAYFWEILTQLYRLARGRCELPACLNVNQLQPRSH